MAQGTIDSNPAGAGPDVIRDDWKKWWEVAKRELKRTAIFWLPSTDQKNRADYLSGARGA